MKTANRVYRGILLGLALATGALLVTSLGACAPQQPPAEQKPAEATPPATPTVTAEATGAPASWGPSSTWVKPTTKPPDPADFVDKVDNPYWTLKPKTRWRYTAKTPEGTEQIEVVVLDETKQVAGITCAVVRDTVKLDGELIEDTFDWYAQDTTGNVWYMGEDVKNYENGKLVDTAGSWEAGKDGALPGIKVWATPTVGKPPYYQEFYEGEAEDLGKDLRTDATATTPAGDYNDLLVVEEWTPLDPGFVERKYYARGVGTVKEEMVRGGNEVVELVEFTAP